MRFFLGQQVRHIRTGGVYTIINVDFVLMKTCNGDWTAAYIYTGYDSIYVRAKDEMEDGRFVPVYEAEK